MRYRAIQEHDRRYPIRLMCRALTVSPAGYYAWRDRPESRRSAANRTLLSAIRVLHRESRETYGSPRIWDALSKQGHGVGKHRIARLMHGAGIRAKYGEEVARHHPVDSPVACGREHPQSSVHGGDAQSGVGRGPHLRLDHRGLTLSGGDARSVLAPCRRLGDGPEIDRGAGRASPQQGAHEPAAQRWAAAPLRSRQPICRHDLPAGADHPRYDPQHVETGATVGTMPVSKASSGLSSASSFIIASTARVTKQPKISSSILRCSIIGGGVTQPSAVTPRPSMKRGRQ